jgi:hypothetical protein
MTAWCKARNRAIIICGYNLRAGTDRPEDSETGLELSAAKQHQARADGLEGLWNCGGETRQAVPEKGLRQAS